MHFRYGLGRWRSGLAKIANETEGIVRVVGVILYVLKLASPTEWAYIGFGTEDRPLHWFTELSVFVVLVASFLIYYLAPDLAWLSTYFSATSVIVLLNVVLLQRTFEPIKSPERSLLLFICNVAQIVFMFATWYQCHYSKTDALFKSVLTFATIGYAECMPLVAMAQIAINFLLLAVFLGFVIGQLERRMGANENLGDL
jgi:hypothetical protein